MDGDHPVFPKHVSNGTPVTADSFLADLHDGDNVAIDGAKIQVFGGSGGGRSSSARVNWKSLVCPCTLSRLVADAHAELIIEGSNQCVMGGIYVSLTLKMRRYQAFTAANEARHGPRVCRI